MHFLILAMLASTSILICFKIFDKLKVDTITAITVNYLVGAILGFISLSELPVAQITNSPWFYLAFLLGFILIAGFILFAISTRQAGIAITSISSRVSVIFSVLLGIFVFNDSIGIVKISGFVLAIVALVLIFSREKNSKISSATIYIPLLVFVLSGMNDSTLKIAQHFFIENNQTDYVRFAATSFFWAFILSIPLIIYHQTKKPKGTNHKSVEPTGLNHVSATAELTGTNHVSQAEPAGINLKSIIAGIVLGTLNWASIYLMLNGLKVMEVSLFFPILNIGVVTLSTIVGYFVFKEKLRTINVIGIAAAVVAIVLITY